jgi:hypothetical protein
MGLHAVKPKKPRTTNKPMHSGSRKGTRLPNAATKDPWGHKGQAKQQG